VSRESKPVIITMHTVEALSAVGFDGLGAFRKSNHFSSPSKEHVGPGISTLAVTR